MQEKKTIEERILKIEYTSKNHFGDVKFVGIKYQNKIGWVAKVQFSNNNYFNSLSTEGSSPTEALKKLQKRINKIIDRYNTI